MSRSKVSICIPAYKQPELLKKLLESILIQTYVDYEIIVTDDTSDSSIEEVCKEYLSKNINLKYIKNVERKGTPENWNEAIRHANGEYIKIMHHDDWFLSKDSLAKFVEMLDRNPRADFAFSGCFWYDPEEKFQSKNSASFFQIYKLKKDPEFLFAKNFISTPSTTIFRKKIGILFDSQFKHVVDFDFYIRALKINPVFEHTKESLVGILIESKDQVTARCLNNKNIRISEYFNLYKKFYPEKRKMKIYVFAYFIYLFNYFNVRSIESLRNCGIKEEIPWKLKSLLWMQKINFFSLPIFILTKLKKIRATFRQSKKQL